MGVKHLSSWFMGKLPKEAIKRCDRLGPVHTLAIDLNDTLHRAMNRANDNENRFYRQVIFLIKQIIRTTRPQHNIGIFMDGVAPSAKLLLQIKRRRSSPPDSMFNAPEFSSLAITPGTPAMRDLAEQIRKEFCSHFRPIHFSSTDEPGEGEVKIVKWLRSLPKRSLGNVLIFGADADFLPILCMNPRLHPSRICLDMPNFQTVPVDGLNQMISGQVKSKKSWMQDLAILMMMLGNDYLPKLAGFSPDTAIKAIRSTGFAPLFHIDLKTERISLDRDNLIRIFEYLCTEMHPNANLAKSFSDHDEGFAEKADIQAFFKGIAWMATMYYTGECPDYTFRMSTRSSTISIPRCLEWLKAAPAKIVSPRSQVPPLDVELAQLVMTPLWGRAMVQPHLQRLMDPDSALGFYFHHPCHVCAGYRAVIRSFQEAAHADNSPEAADYRRNISSEYSLHIQESHSSTWVSPPITKIRKALDLLRREHQ